MSVTTTNLIQGPATIYLGTFGAAEPADTAINSTPAASAWTDLGGTQGGLEITIKQDYKNLEVDQIVDNPGARLVAREATAKTSLAEATLENLAYVLNDGTAGSGSGYKNLEPIAGSAATQPTYHALMFDGYGPSGYRRRVILRKTLSTENIKTEYKKDGQTLWDVTWTCFYVSSVILPFKFVDATS